jgi:hypothetical protein
MDAEQFDTAAKAIGQGNSRRWLLTGLVGFVLVGRLGSSETAAKPSRKRRQGQVRASAGPLKPNGRKCSGPGQCLSNLCCPPSKGKQGTCRECCGDNASTCPDAPNFVTIPVCSAGTCTVTCAAGWGNCDNDSSNGCETPLNTPIHCRTCNENCTGFADACNDPECTANGCGPKPAREGQQCRSNPDGFCNNGSCEVSSS